MKISRKKRPRLSIEVSHLRVAERAKLTPDRARILGKTNEIISEVILMKEKGEWLHPPFFNWWSQRDSVKDRSYEFFQFP